MQTVFLSKPCLTCRDLESNDAISMVSFICLLANVEKKLNVKRNSTCSCVIYRSTMEL